MPTGPFFCKCQVASRIAYSAALRPIDVASARRSASMPAAAAKRSATNSRNLRSEPSTSSSGRLTVRFFADPREPVELLSSEARFFGIDASLPLTVDMLQIHEGAVLRNIDANVTSRGATDYR